MKSAATKPSIVLCHGIWADGSSFSKVIPALQADGHEVIAAQYGLDTFAGDVATVKRTLGTTRSFIFAKQGEYMQKSEAECPGPLIKNSARVPEGRLNFL